MTPYILGYKTFGLNFVQIYKNGNNFSYPKHIPFFGYNLNPSMTIFPNNFKCYKIHPIHYNFNILLKPVDNFDKGNIHIYNKILNLSQFIKKDYFFNNFKYNLQTKICYKNNIYECVKMNGLFICKNNSEIGYKIGYKNDYLMKIDNHFFVVENNDFDNNYRKLVIQTQSMNQKSVINDWYNLLIFYNYFLLSLKFFFKNSVTITIHYPIFSWVNNEIVIQSEKYIITSNKFNYPKVEIFNKLVNKKFTYEIENFSVKEINNVQYLLYYFYYFKYMIF
jgi:hypothetical protein